jgi:chorismate dehydratase
MNASRQLPRPLLRLGRIGYLNVLPIYHALETGEVEGHYQVASGPPAELNRLMAAGALDVSAASSIEYARRPEEYLLVPDLAIGSCGPVRSVLLLSRGPVGGLGGETILVSSQTHTSAALLKVLLADNLRLETSFRTGDATSLHSGHRRRGPEPAKAPGLPPLPGPGGVLEGMDGPAVHFRGLDRPGALSAR